MPRLRLVARFGGAGKPGLSRFLLGSVAAHVLFVAAMILAPALAGRREPAKPAVVVGLVAPAAVPKGVPAPPTPAAPPTAEPRRPVPLPAPPKKAPQKTSKPAEKAPVEPPPAPSAGPPSPDATPTQATPTQASGGAGITPLGGTAGDELDWYRALVASALLAQWRKPILDELAGGALEVTVMCEIQRDGSIRDLRVAIKSGVPSLDRSAQRAVMDAVPLPPLPRTWTGSSLSAGFVFQLSPER